MSTQLRYVNLDQFRALHGTVKDSHLIVEREHVDTEGLVVLMPQIPKVRGLGGHDSRMVEFRITDETVDRMADIIKTDGWDTGNYEKNPVVLWAHSHYDPPIGKSIELVVDKKKREVRSIAEFTPKDLNPLGYMIYQMYLQDFMRAVSVGFTPKEYTWVSSQSDAERARRGGIDFIKQEMLEYSSVPVPANPNALALAKSAGIDVTPLKQWAEQVLDEGSTRNLSADARRHLEVLRVATSPVGRALYLEIGDMKMAATPKEDPPAAPPSPAADATKTVETPAEETVVKEVVTRRWDCGTADHVHATKEDATECSGFDLRIADMIKGIDNIVKAGRVLSKKNETALRAAVEALNGVLAQLDAADDGEEDTSGKSGVAAITFADDAGEREDAAAQSMLLSMTVEQLNAAITAGTTDAINRATGRVD